MPGPYARGLCARKSINPTFGVKLGRSKPDRSEFSHLTEGATGPDLTLIRVGGDGGDTRRLRPLRPKKV